MARTKHTSRKLREPVMTWTRFILPPNQEWPTWPCDLSEPLGKDAQTGPLGNREDVHAAYVGRMVEDPAQAVFLIDWDDRKSLNTFLASPACDDFLRLLPEEVPLLALPKTENNSEKSLQDQQPGNLGSTKNESALQPLEVIDEPQRVAASASASTSSPSPSSPRSPPPARSRFLILDRLDHWCSIQIKGRITLSAFLVSADNKDGLQATFENDIRGILGNEHFMPDLEYVYRDRSRFNWAIDFSWFCGSAVGCVGNREEDSQDVGSQWMLERILLGGGDVDVFACSRAQTLGQPETRGPINYVICEITQWDAFEGKEEIEEKVAHDVEFSQEREEQAEALKADGVIKAWKRERWDLRPCPGFVSYWEYF